MASRWTGLPHFVALSEGYDPKLDADFTRCVSKTWPRPSRRGRLKRAASGRHHEAVNETELT